MDTNCKHKETRTFAPNCGAKMDGGANHEAD